MRNSIRNTGKSHEELRADREFRMNPPEYAPGQGDSDGWNLDVGGNDMGNSGSQEEFPFGNSGGNVPSFDDIAGSVPQSTWSGGNNQQDVNSYLNSSGGIPGQGMTTPGVQQQAPMGSYEQSGGLLSRDEEMFEKALFEGTKAAVNASKIAGKGAKTLFEDIKEAFEDNAVEDRCVYGRYAVRGGFGTFAVGFAGILLSKIAGLNSDAFLAVMSGSILSLAINIPIFCASYDKRRRMRESGELDETEDDQIDEEENQEDFDFEKEFGNYDDSDLNIPDMDSYSDNGEDLFSSLDEDSDDFFQDWGEEDDDNTPIEGGIYQEDINIDSMIDDLKDKEVPVGMYTRQYLVETFSNVLPLINPRFSDLKEIGSESQDFLDYEDNLREAALTQGVKDDYDSLPELIGLRENMFIVQLEVSRSKACVGKEEAIANEIVAMYKYNEYGQKIEERESVYAVVNTVGSTFYINMFVGRSVMISLGDIYRKERDFILDPHNKMPCIWGTNEFGQVLKCDIYKDNSFIISGSPRAGKSWKIQSMLLQLCMYNSPEDINIYVFDFKYTDSDYYRMSKLLPHFKGFEHEPQRILQKLRDLTSEKENKVTGYVGEAERRRRIISKYDMLNILDLKEKHPEVKLPFIYVVIDEMKSLMGHLTKEESQEFQTLLGCLVSQLPNRGYRVILVPHRITNEIISKQIYTLVNCRAAVKAPFDEIKTGMEITRKDFPYELPDYGDMALRINEINNNKVVYCHGDVITSHNSTNLDVFRYVGEVWKRLCPGCDEDAVGNTKRVVPTAVDRSDEKYDKGDLVGRVKVSDSFSIDDLEDDDDDIFSIWDNK